MGSEIDHSPLDVVAWHGNYAPYKYDLRRLHAGRIDPVRPSRSVDLHRADRSVGATPGTANIDFVIFPERWLVARTRSVRPGTT